MPIPVPEGLPRKRRPGAESSSCRTSACDCRDTRTASADVTQPEHAKQSVREIWAGGRSEGSGWSVLKLTS